MTTKSKPLTVAEARAAFDLDPDDVSGNRRVDALITAVRAEERAAALEEAAYAVDDVSAEYRRALDGEPRKGRRDRLMAQMGAAEHCGSSVRALARMEKP